MENLTIARNSAYEAATLTDNLWQDELNRVYADGNKARYDRTLNRATPTLKVLYEIRMHALDAWRKLGTIERNEIAA